MGLFIRAETLFQLGLAAGLVELLSGFVFLTHRRIGFALPLMKERVEGAEFVERIRHPHARFEGGLIAGHQTLASIRGPTQGVEIVTLYLGKMRAPGLRRTIRS